MPVTDKSLVGQSTTYRRKFEKINSPKVTAIFKDQPEVKLFCQGFTRRPLPTAGHSNPKQSAQRSLKSVVDQLNQPAIHLDYATYISLLRWCGKYNALLDGKHVHRHIDESGLMQNAVLRSHLVHMYAKCGALEDATAIFASMHERNVILWNLMIGLHIRSGKYSKGLEFFNQMKQDGVTASKVTYVCILSTCAKQMDLAEVKRMHAYICANEFELDVIVGTALVNMYGKCDSLEDALILFGRIAKQDLFLWNTMIAVYVQHGLGKKAFQLFDQMHCEAILPDEVTFVSILGACTSCAALMKGKQMHILILHNKFQSNLIVETALVSLYGKCGRLEDARNIFDEVANQDVVLWTAMIAVYSDKGYSKEAFHMFNLMQEKGVLPNKVTFLSILTACSSKAMYVVGVQVHAYILLSKLELDVSVGNALITMYGKCDSLEVAQRMFLEMHERDVVSYNALIALYTEQSQHEEALQLSNGMQLEGLLPDKATCVNIISIFASNAVLIEAKRVHAYIFERGLESDVTICNALIHMYGKCGSGEDAQKMFDGMDERDVISYNVFIGACMQNGMGKKGFQVFNRMQREGVMPNEITFVSILDGCGREAALSEGKWTHKHILESGLEASIVVGSALINTYSKCGGLEDSQKVFDDLYHEDVVSWNSIITAYAQHGQARKALRLFKDMQLGGVEPNEVTFLSILVACSHSGLIDEGCCCFTAMSACRGISQELDHYICMVDLLGRAGQLDEAESMISSMPFGPTVVLLMALLGACRCRTDVARAEFAANYVLLLDPENAAPYIMLSNIYAAADREKKAWLLEVR